MRKLLLISVCCIHFTAFSQDVENNTSSNQQPNLPYITKKMGNFYLDNGLVYDKGQFKEFLITNHLEPIWAKYSSGNRQFITGLAMIGGSIALEVLGFTLIYDGVDVGNVLLGYIFASVGGITFGAGLPLTIVGSVRKKNAIRNYNAMYAGKPPTQYSQNVTYKIGLVGNGIGFSLNF